MKILVTGGAGFIGSNFIHYLLRKYPDYEVINLDKLTYAGNLENLRDIEKDTRYHFIQGDITDNNAVDPIFKTGIDVIVNYAAETHVDRSITGPKDFLETDVFGTFTLLEAARKYGIQKYIQISTDEVYGSIETGKFTETSPFLPNSPYSASKAGGDHLCRAYHITYGLPIIVTHSCNVYGPYQYPEKVIPLFVTNLLRGKKVPLYGDGENIREWLFTEDHCLAIDLIIHQGKAGEVYNIGSGHEITNKQLTTLILKAFNAEEDQIEYVPDRLGHDRRYAIDFSKLSHDLGYSPQYTFEETLRQTITWYKNNNQWWEPLLINP